jgi:hypothetical protein
MSRYRIYEEESNQSVEKITKLGASTFVIIIECGYSNEIKDGMIKELSSEPCNEFIAAKCRGLGHRPRCDVTVKLD